MPDKVTEKLKEVEMIVEQVKVFTPDAVDTIIDQNVTSNVTLAGEGWGFFSRIKAKFGKKKKKKV